MLTCLEQLQTLDDLKTYVNKTLCEHEQLEASAFRMTEQILVRSSKPCGMYFCLHGPRETKFSAIWETERNTILFYDSTGERFQTTQLLPAAKLQIGAA
jgi:hypothetical protein